MAAHHWNPAEGPVTEGALRVRLEALGYQIARSEYKPGAVVPDHRHGVDTIDAVVSGRFRVVVGGHLMVLGPGDWVEIPRGSVHSASVLGDLPVVTLDAVKL